MNGRAVFGLLFLLLGSCWTLLWAVSPPDPYQPLLRVTAGSLVFDGFGTSLPGTVALLGLGPVAIGGVLFVTGWVESTANRL
ncbi:hypothetical protein [Haloarchaeobius amylolyticus]|uniref:hypothetical protein n=1 Tax=Haloarchaeobius amylolyticus TaxID=1198296 RepID=UPI002271C75B|nr:hypothetical protein [Haloarchaeobius amylolyticus]